MPSNSRKPRTKSSTRVPTQWSEWEWSTAYNRFARYRLNESGEYEYEYQAEEHNSSNPPFGHSTTTSQLCGEMRDTSGQVIDLGEVSRALEATREAVFRQSLHGSWPVKFFQERIRFDRKAENQPYIEWLQHALDKNDMTGAAKEDEEEEDDDDENRDENSPAERSREMDQVQNQQPDTGVYQTTPYQPTPYQTTTYQTTPYQTTPYQTDNASPSYYPTLNSSTESCPAIDYAPSNKSAGSRTARSQADTLDTKFRVNHSNKFKMGCVFKVLWSEPRSEPSGLGRTELIAESSTSYHKIRQFIVVSEDKGHSMCIPILTYGSRGVTKDRIHPADHAMIYTSRQAKGEEKSRTNWKDARWWKCCEKGPARLEVNPDSAVDLSPNCNHEKCISCENMWAEQKPKILSYLNLSKTYGVENNLKVCFTGYMDETNVERLLCRDSAWEWSDTGEDILVIMEDQPYPSCTYRCWYRCWRLQLLYGDDISQKIKGLLGLSSGVMMSSSSVYLNNRMGLYESSLIMEKMSNAATFHHDLGHLLYTIPNELIFVSFVLGTAGLTGITVAWLRARNEIRLPTFGLTIAGALASWMLGFSVEEIILVCLPLILGCSILCSSVLLWKKARSAEKEEKIELISNV